MADQYARLEGVLSSDTIAAAATAAGRAAIGIVRISGPEASRIGAAICGRMLKPRQAEFSHFRNADGETIDEGIAIFFPPPA